MPFGQSVIAAFVAGEIAGYIAERVDVSPKNVRLTKSVVAAGTGIVTAVVTGDPIGIVGTVILGTAYLGGYDPVYLVAQSFFDSLRDSGSKKTA